MHITIEHHDKREYPQQQQPGWFGTRKTILVTDRAHWVKALVQLSEDEQRIIEKNNLWDYTLFSIPNRRNLEAFHKIVQEHRERFGLNHPAEPRETPPTEAHISIRRFLKPDGFWQKCDNLSDAKNWAGELRTHIQHLKDVIDHVATPPTNETFDL
jgi:hypothetical protein